nr:hypothetical protein [Paenibacillus chinjuensis]
MKQAKASAYKGNTNAVQAQLKAFMNQVNAQSGKALTEQQAQVLTDIVQLLK